MGQRTTVLLAEDDATSRRIMAHLLRHNDYEVLVAEDGSEALDLIGPEVAVALIDWMMPGVDGVEVNVDQHRKRRPGYRVPGVEGLFLVGDSLKAPGAGGDVGHESVLECYREITGRDA